VRRRSVVGMVAALLVVTAAAVLPGCGGGGKQDATVLPAGQIDIKLPRGYKVVGGKVVAPPGASRSAGSSGTTAPSSSATTIPLNNQQDPTTALFSALSKFRSCLDGLGVKFIGGPDASNPQSPTNDPDYLKSLGTCAARSNIQQALQTAQTANDNLTPAEIQQRNKAYLKWRTCMIGRGWKIADPVPDAQGRLFAFGANSGNQIQAPPGKDVLSSPDVQDCAAKVRPKTTTSSK